MPEHTSFFSYLIAMFPALGQNLHNLEQHDSLGRWGRTVFDKPLGQNTAEPLVASALIVALIIVLAFVTKAKVTDYDKSVIPDAKLSLRTFMEVLVGYFYDLMKEMMGAKRAKRYFPIVGTCAVFIFFSNVVGLIPGFDPPTSHWNITLGCALVVFVAFNYYGIKENGLGYFKHLAGPVWWMAPLIFPLEVVSLLLRPLTLSIRLMLNMAVDHVLLAIVFGLVPFLVPIPIMMLGTLIALVQVLVFCLLSSIYITLATEHEEHDHAPSHAKSGGNKAHAAAAA